MAMLTDEAVTESTPRVVPVRTSDVIVAADATASGLPSASGTAVAPQPAEDLAVGIEGEETVWEGRYSLRNFLGRSLVGGLLAAIWAMLAFDAWGLGRESWEFLAILFGIGALVFWVHLAYQLIRASQSHHYRLTTRRLFVASGFFHHRVDQIELLRIKDLYIQQSMTGSWLGVGTVFVISSEQTLPRAALVGIDEPERIMDLIWHHTRLEQDRKTTKVENV